MLNFKAIKCNLHGNDTLNTFLFCRNSDEIGFLFFTKVFIDILYFKCYKHKSCNEDGANCLGNFHATLACF